MKPIMIMLSLFVGFFLLLGMFNQVLLFLADVPYSGEAMFVVFIVGAAIFISALFKRI